MNIPFIAIIIPHISQQGRYHLFSIVDDLLEGKYKETAKALGIKQSAYYGFKGKNLKISDAKTMLLLNLLHGKDRKKFNEFLAPIVLKAKHQISILSDCVNSGLDFNMVEKLYTIYQRYEAKKQELAMQKV